MAKPKNLVLSDAEEAFILAFRNLLSDVEPEEVEDDEDVEEVDDEDAEPLDRAEVEAMAIKELRETAKEYLGDDAPTKKADILEALEEYYDEDEDEDEEDEEDEEADEDEDDDEDSWDRETLEDEDLKSLRKIARDEGHTAADYKGMDTDELIDLIMGEEADDEDEEDEDEEDDDTEVLDEDALNDMTHKELVALARELSIKVPVKLKSAGKGAAAKKTHAALVTLILDSGEDE